MTTPQSDRRFPAQIQSEDELDDVLTRPREVLGAAVRQLQSPLIILGASGKMGPSLCVLARRAAVAAGHDLRVVAVSRFSDQRARAWLEARGVETLRCDLLNRDEVERLPDSVNVAYLVGLKFGTQQNPSLTWAVNTVVPSLVSQRYPQARVVVLSTGNVYPFVPVTGGGATEDTPPNPVGEYGTAALAKERVFEHYSRTQGNPMVLLRLNYAVELRYGVLLDLAERVWSNASIDLATGHVNCIWQGDANEFILRSFSLAQSPPAILNLTGPSVLSVRELAVRFAEHMRRTPNFAGRESDTALLSNPARLCALLGPPPTPVDEILPATARWIVKGGPTLGKPTHFEVRTGQF